MCILGTLLAGSLGIGGWHTNAALIKSERDDDDGFVFSEHEAHDQDIFSSQLGLRETFSATQRVSPRRGLRCSTDQKRLFENRGAGRRGDTA